VDALFERNPPHEGGAGSIVVPAVDEDVLRSDAEAWIGPLRFDKAPTHGLTDVDAGLKEIGGSLGRPVAREDVIDRALFSKKSLFCPNRPIFFRRHAGLE
jgi:hypothetical protein